MQKRFCFFSPIKKLLTIADKSCKIKKAFNEVKHKSKFYEGNQYKQRNLSTESCVWWEAATELF